MTARTLAAIAEPRAEHTRLGWLLPLLAISAALWCLIIAGVLWATS